ncbi:MAG TPA: hypothetical protein VE262_08405 [Blastocatellia bacterium]|nr:hypothetical protein [Blastocatellia bacterium]
MLILITSFPQALAQSAGKPLPLPVRYDEHRFFVEPVTLDRKRLSFFTDTGGGLFIFSDAVEQLKIPILKMQEGGQTLEMVKLPEFSEGASIPAPLGNRGHLFVLASARRDPLSQEWSGMLGQQWFADRVWTFDYPNKRLLLRADGDLPEGKDEHRVRLGFKADSSGKRATHFPRIQVSVDGEAVDLLFDTGASTELTETALAELKDKRPAVRATSFITANLFEKWRKRHPEWRVIEAAEKRSGEAMIEVPKVVVAGYTVGPVWFTRRADKNFHEYMSQWMDKRIEGALGGNALYHFIVTVDYPRAIAVFEK